MKKLALGALLLLSTLGFSQDTEIKSYANEKWGTDYTMVKYEIEKQQEAKDAFLNLYKKYDCSSEENKKSNINVSECNIIIDAYVKWSVENREKQIDWTMALYEAKKQFQAYNDVK